MASGDLFACHTSTADRLSNSTTRRADATSRRDGMSIDRPGLVEEITIEVEMGSDRMGFARLRPRSVTGRGGGRSFDTVCAAEQRPVRGGAGAEEPLEMVAQADRGVESGVGGDPLDGVVGGFEQQTGAIGALMQ